MAEFAKISKQPKTGFSTGNLQTTKDGQENQSYGFLPTYKVQTGNTMGDMIIKGRIMVTDTSRVVRLVMGYDPGKF